jgi:hypothetical protein
MITITINPESFALGFILGTAVYAVAGGIAYVLFLAGKHLARLGASLQRHSLPPRRRLELVR